MYYKIPKKNNKQYYRYPIKSTPLQFLLDKDFLIDKIISSELLEINEKFIFIQIDEGNNKIDVFFSKKDYCKLVFPIDRIKKLTKKYKDKSRMLGDRKASKCILIPLKELFNKENIA